jgi:hypothetical protein
MARYGKTEEIRLHAARRIQNTNALKQLAREAKQESIRVEAALLAGDQASLAAQALNAWDIEQGEKIVRYISNTLLLMRIARSARQDSVRLAAALRLTDESFLRNLSKTTLDVQVRWRIARYLDDPNLLADIARFKLANDHFGQLRRQARCLLLNHLDKLQMERNSNALIGFIQSQSLPDYKIEAFIRIPPEDIKPLFIQELAHSDLRHTSQMPIRKMLQKITNCGWHTTQIMISTMCSHCLGKGTSLEKSVYANKNRFSYVDLPCVECDGRGRVQLRQVTCLMEGQAPISFKLPAKARLQRLSEED